MSFRPSEETLRSDSDARTLTNNDEKNPTTTTTSTKPSPNEEPIVRPTTPPQGTNHNPWTSYHDLPADHPVFRYPDEMREKMYAKGIGKAFHFSSLSSTVLSATFSNHHFPLFTDPVVKAEMDLARLGKVHGESSHGKSFWKRGTSMMGSIGTMSMGGAF